MMRVRRQFARPDVWAVAERGEGTGARRRRLGRSLLAVLAAVVVSAGFGASAASAGITTVTFAGSGTGTVIGEPDQIACSNIPGSPLTSCEKDWGFNFASLGLTAVGGPGSSFVGWSGTVAGTCVGATNPCTTQFLSASFNAIARFEPTPEPPTVATGALTDIRFPSATVSGTVNPNSEIFPVTSCYIEYGLTTDYGERTPCRPGAIGAGTDPVAVSATIGALEPSKTYHYRLVAVNAAASSPGPDMTFVSASAAADPCPNAAIRAQQGALALRLPYCFAYELVSPPFAGGAAAFASAGTADGTTAAVYSIADFGDAGSLGILGASYRTVRTDSGWKTSSLGPAASFMPYTPTGGPAIDYTRDGSRSLYFGNLRADEGTARMTPVVREPDGTFRPAGPTQNDSELPQGASADLSTVLQSTTTRIPLTDGTADTRDSARIGLYLSTRDENGHLAVRQVAHRNGTTMFPGCSILAGGAGPNGGSLYGRNALSHDAKRLFFTAGMGTGCDAASARRVWAKVGAAAPIDISASQCPATCGAEATAQFRGASRDGSRVYFATTQRLLPEDQDTSAQNDLYEYDFNAPGSKLRMVTGSSAPVGANVAAVGMFRVSMDGAYVYFTATGRALTSVPNARGALPGAGTSLYVYHRPAGAQAGTTQFIGRLTSANEQAIQLASSGRYALFATTSDLTGSRLAGDTQPDVYRYDAQTDELTRIWSSDPARNGTARIGSVFLSNANGSTGANPSAASARVSTGGWYEDLQITDDGSLVGFSTIEPLSPLDRNKTWDAYLWDAATGQFTILSDGTSSAMNIYHGARFSGMTPSGNALFLRTKSSLLRSHDSEAIASYVLRRGGGFPEPPAEGEPCDGDACQGGPSAPREPKARAGSSVFDGAGNVVPVRVPRASLKVSAVGPVRGSVVRVPVRVSGKGALTVTGAGVRRASLPVSRSGTYRVSVRLSAQGRRTLMRKKRVKVRATVRFVPAEGKAVTVKVPITLVSKAKKRSSSASARRASVLSTSEQKGR